MQWKALFVGDLYLGQDPGKFSLSTEFAALLQQHAIRSCNFEAPISGVGKPIRKAGPHISQHASAASVVEQSGFNLVNLANNHLYDYGPDALQATIGAFKNAVTVGAGNFDEAYSLKKITVQGITVGCLSFCEAEFGALTVNSLNKKGYAWINHPIVNSLVLDCRKQVDVLIIQCHAGVEEIDIPLPQWRERYRELIRMGADAIIGSHPHVPQGWELYQDKPIFYSLGNFYVDLQSNNPFWNTGLAVSLTFNDAAYTAFEIIPLKNVRGKIVVNEDENFKKHLAGINRLLQEPVYSKTVDETAKRLWDQYYRAYYNIALRGIHGEVTLSQAIKTFARRLLGGQSARINTALLLHNIRIESHRWIVERVLEMQNSE